MSDENKDMNYEEKEVMQNDAVMPENEGRDDEGARGKAKKFFLAESLEHAQNIRENFLVQLKEHAVSVCFRLLQTKKINIKRYAIQLLVTQS